MPGWQCERPPPSVLVGQRAVEAHAAVGDERPAFALLAEAEPLERLQHHRRERVVDLADVDLFGRDARPLERERAAAGRGRLGEVVPLAHRGVRRRLAGAEHPHRLLRQVAGALLGGEHDRAAAVAADAAVQLGERVGDHPRALHVVDRDRVAVVGLGIVRRVAARRHRDLGELLDRGAELVHVAAGGHRVLRDQRVPERRVELHRAAAAEREVRAAPAGLQVGARRRSVHEHDDFDVAGHDRGGRVLDHELPRGAAHAGAVDPGGPQAEVLADLDRR